MKPIYRNDVLTYKFSDECTSFTEQFNKEDALLMDIIS